jgi:hypothetical protein
MVAIAFGLTAATVATAEASPRAASGSRVEVVGMNVPTPTAHAGATPLVSESLAPVSVRPSITIRVDDRRITSPPRVRAGYVDVRIVTSGKVHHHLAFWHLNAGVTVKRFTRALHSPAGPFALGTAVGGNAPMPAGRLDTSMHLLPGTVVLADIVDGPTTRIASFEVVGQPAFTRPPTAAGTIVNKSFRFVLPARFGQPGVYRFKNVDQVAHDGVIYSLRDGKTAADLARWFRAGGKGRPPVVFERPLGGPGVTGSHWATWFKLPKLAAGRYVLGCFLPDDRGVPHAATGMVAGFEVR